MRFIQIVVVLCFECAQYSHPGLRQLDFFSVVFFFFWQVTVYLVFQPLLEALGGYFTQSKLVQDATDFAVMPALVVCDVLEILIHNVHVQLEDIWLLYIF